MKKIFILLLTVVVLVSIIFAGCVPGAAPPVTPPPVTPPEPAAELPTYRWRIITPYPAILNAEVVQPVLDDLTAALAGRVEFELYATAEIMPDDQVIRALQTGTLDIAYVCEPIAAVPIDIAELAGDPPFAWDSPQEVFTMWHERGMKEVYEEAYADLGGIHHLGFACTDPLHLISTKPVWKYEDLKGMKINGAAQLTHIFDDAGAVSIYIPLEEMYLAGQTGLIDGLMWGGSTEGYLNSWHEVFPYFLTNPIVGACGTSWLMNEDLWNSIPSDMQAILELFVEAYGLRTNAYYYSGESSTRHYFTLTTMPGEDWNKVRQSQIEYWDEIAQTSPRCARLVKIYKDYMEEVEAAGWWR